jgi:3-deoxy-D-manno-octulosonic-acid transferase
MQWLYSLLVVLTTPLVLGYMLWRSVRDPAWRANLSERYGYGAARDRQSLWVHAASFGEIQASAPLVQALTTQYPGLPLVITTTTPIGAARARALFEGADVRFAPFDLPGAVRRFLVRVQPKVAVVLETELWPNLYRECARRGVPMVIASARMAERSVRRYRRLNALTPAVFSPVVAIGAQSEADAARFVTVGADPARVHVTGNLKFDFELPPSVSDRGRRWRSANAPDRPVWIAGSTHEGEEEQALDAHAVVCARHPRALLVLVPRHARRFGDVQSMLERRGLAFVTRSSSERVTPDTQVVLGDTMGELLSLYAGADVAFVGGSLAPIGGHNLLEPAACGVPILTGPHNFHGAETAQMLVEAGAAQVITDGVALATEVTRLFADATARKDMGARGRRVVEENRGALERLLRLIRPLIGDGQRTPLR